MMANENENRKSSLDINLSDQALPIPVQIFLWKQVRYLNVYHSPFVLNVC